ncbi:MAG: response regulator [Deltaproteobacteria bacterium HGW-Deltaproteobacteria-14]|jgi:CheY-like chemotaxis protein|nr:MAG: response regulator [Deltaproteobacteria bacterium HGW-Deltaproteobacteria-14]
MARILMIDDDPDIIESLRLVLEAHGHEVHELASTRHVVEDVKRVAPDLIILDVMFPEDPQGGFKAARQLHREPGVNVIPVILLSAVNQRSRLGFAFTDSDISEDFMPVQRFIEKPIEPKLLLDLIAELLS